MTTRVRSILFGCLAAVAALSPAASGQIPAGKVPAEFDGVGINDRRGETIPMDLEFTDENGEVVTLDRYFESGKPVMLTPVYYQCPMLCNLLLNGLVNGMNDMDWSAGDEFEIVTFSFNPKEEHKLAEVKKRAYLTQYKRDTAAAGWHFLTGTPEAIDILTDEIGYGFRYDEKTGEYAHSSTIVFLTPEGVISLYMDDVVFEARDLRLALVEASQGAIGSPLDQFALFFCFQYDPESNSYKVVAWKIMRAGGLLTLMLLVGGLGVLWMREIKNRGGPQTPVRAATAGGMES